MDFNRYFNNSELEDQLKTWEKEYPGIIEISTIGKSYSDNPIWLATITNKSSGEDIKKPAIWLDGNIHATEIAGTTTTLRIIYELITQFGQNDHITDLVNQNTFYIVPRVNPDGAALAMADTPKYIRSGIRPYPYEDKMEGIHSEDVDGDGRILQMRIIDPSGDWKISTLNPRLMEKRKPDEHGGEYYRLIPEGKIEDFDGFLIKLARPVEGLDFNRNFPTGWRPENEQSGAGPYPVSEVEVRAVIDFISKHPNINCAITYHTYSGVILRPLSGKPDSEMDIHDLWTYQAIGERGTELTGYKCLSVFHDFKYHPKEVITGAFDDWAYDNYGIFSFTIELWDIVGRAGIEDRKFIEWMRKHPHEDDIKILEWAEKNVGSDIYVDWYPFKHDQLGEVEIGGWNTFYTWRNPPHQYMGEEAERNIAFVLALGDMLPQLKIHTLEVNKLSENKYHLNLVIENYGFLPTYTSNQGKQRKAMRPVRVQLSLPNGVELIQGKQKTEIGHLEGRSNKTSIFSFGSSETDNRARAEWVLKGSSGNKVTIDILSDRAGSLTKEITLE